MKYIYLSFCFVMSSILSFSNDESDYIINQSLMIHLLIIKKMDYIKKLTLVKEIF